MVFKILEESYGVYFVEVKVKIYEVIEDIFNYFLDFIKEVVRVVLRKEILGFFSFK